VNVECRRAGIGCVDDKRELLKHLLAYLKPMQEKRKELNASPKQVAEIIAAGSAKARVVAKETLARVQDAMKL
jgi:tryptophanyl-tRNA synthetase